MKDMWKGPQHCYSAGDLEPRAVWAKLQRKGTTCAAQELRARFEMSDILRGRVSWMTFGPGEVLGNDTIIRRCRVRDRLSPILKKRKLCPKNLCHPRGSPQE
jgi:hypothetical protein